MKRAGRMSVAAGWAAIALMVVTSAVSVTASSQSLSADPADFGNVLRAMKAAGATEPPLIHKTEEGFLRFLGAPRGGSFAARQPVQNSDGAAGVAKNFTGDHAGAFGVANVQVSFATLSVQQHLGQSIVRLDQSYGGLPIFGAQMIVTVNANGTVANVMSDVLYDTRSLDSGAVSLTATIDAATAIIKAKTGLAALLDGVSSSALTAENEPTLTVFSPSVLGLNGTTALTWRLILAGDGPDGPIRREAFVDAHSGALINSYSLIHDALVRVILDPAGNLLRAEGDPPSGITDADLAYDFLGDTYDYFWEQQGRDGIDGFGSPLIATVGIVGLANAFWNGFTMTFGEGWVTDDVTPHELTHGVTERTANLIFQGWSGAINESMSDIWGEIVDFTNGAGDDTPQNRWLIGEEIPGIGAIRNMKDPPQFGSPDSLESPLVINPNSFFDFGGVHFNSGIGNKLCYLLTDGASFNGETVFGLGHEIVTDLFYGCLLTLGPSADYFDLYFALEAVALSMDLSDAERCNIFAAARAVRIVPPEAFLPVSRLKVTSAFQDDGRPAVVLTWDEPMKICANPVDISREEMGVGKATGDVVILAEDVTGAVLDTDVRAGIEYVYTLETRHPFTAESIFLVAAIVVGEPEREALTEAYDNDPRTAGVQPIDLSFTQVTYAPTGAPAGGLGGIPDYEVTVQRNVNALPVARSDADGSAFIVPLIQQGGVLVPLADNFFFGGAGSDNFENFQFPFFDGLYSRLYIGANGYIAFAPIEPSSSLNEATLDAHHAVPRISFLFGDLVPDAFGQVWIRELDDRAVITFEEIPEDIQDFFSAGNTVQAELFTSGLIRITYQSVGMENAIVGLSDGTGVPVNPSLLFPGFNLRDQPAQSDISLKPQLPGRLTLSPVGTQELAAGERAEFTIEAVLPSGFEGSDPEFFLQSGPGVLIDQGVTARYIWDDTQWGLHSVRVAAMLGDQMTFQDIRLAVDFVFERPVATMLTLSSDVPIEDGTLDIGHPLIADYVYEHPLAETQPLSYGEGITVINWFRNGQQITALANQRAIPATKLLPGDTWQFRVTPATLNFIFGLEAASPRVTIAGGPEIVSVTPAFGLITGGATVSIKGNSLNGPLSVKFGGVNAASYRVVSDNEISAVTPVHGAGAVDIEVETGRGTGVLVQGFRFLEDTGDILIGDINGDGRVDALDVQLVVGAVLEVSTLKSGINADANEDGVVNASDVQLVVNRALYR